MGNPSTETQEKLWQRDTLRPTARSLRVGPGLFDGQESKVFRVVVAQATSGARILPFGEGDRRETVGTERQGQDKKGRDRISEVSEGIQRKQVIAGFVWK